MTGLRNRTKWLLAAGAAVACGGAVWLLVGTRAPAPDPALAASLNSVTAAYRKIIVLMDGADSLDEEVRARCRTAGRRLFWEKQQALDKLATALAGRPRGKVEQAVAYVANHGLRDADKLAFLDLFEEVAGGDTAPSRGRLDDALKQTLDDLHSIQLTYRQEVTRIFSQFTTRGPGGRERWDAYVQYLRTLHTREQILAAYDDQVSDTMEADSRGPGNEIFGTDFPEKTVALTFDDGPHPKYTEEVAALLRKYGIRACFFELGQNLGTVPAPDQPALARTAEISRRLLAAGHVLANHTYSHRVMVKLSEAERTSEIERTNLLLAKVAGRKPVLFRPPYGSRNRQVLDQVTQEGLRNVMWTIDSEDWADPIPESIAMRVLHELARSQKGIILFHDIHKQSVLALPQVIEELNRQGYAFASFDGAGFSNAPPPVGSERAAPAPVETAAGARLNPYRESWAVIIGINHYQHWPQLRYPVNDANGIEQVLVSNFGFKRENIRKLVNGEATRQRIMQVLGDELTDPKRISRDDRVFFFFAGHGATRTLPDGRQIGFVVPVDADQANYYSTAISMNTLREVSDLIPAKHIYFVMDSCYSGLALSRGAGTFAANQSYLEEVTRRVARQILTAGGADQQVSDDGPGGHSVFTWTLLQGLDGKADLDGNGVITASELGAYVSPIVSSFSKQTPTMGNLVGSEGGEFVFELKPQELTSLTPQLEGRGRELNNQLASLEKQIAARQAELLKLQQSIQAENAKLAMLTRAPAPKPTARPQQARAYDLDRRALQLYREKRYDEAEKALRQAVDLKPNDATLLNNLGFIYYRMDRFSDAATWLEKTVALDAKRKEARGNLGDTYLKLGRRAEAKEQYQKYLELYPNSPRAEEVRRILTGL